MRQKAIGINEKVAIIFKLQTKLFPFNLRGPNLQIKWMNSNFSFKHLLTLLRRPPVASDLLFLSEKNLFISYWKCFRDMELCYYLSHDIVQGPPKKRTYCSKLTISKCGGLKCSECFILSSLSSNQICNLFKKCPFLSGLKNQDLVNAKYCLKPSLGSWS